MPKRKERMAGYIRESDPTLANSTTIESQAKIVRQYSEKEHYLYEPRHEFKEAISAYMVPYMERPQLLKLLEAAKRKEFDVLVVAEVRAISRRQVEVFIVYDMLQKYGIRLETVKERFEDDAMGRLILGLRAAYAEIEREQSYVRMQRGKKDRIEIGQAPPNGHRCYGYILVDTEREVKGRYEFNQQIIYIDQENIEWSEYTVRKHILELLTQGETLHGIANRLNDRGIPPPRKPRKGDGKGCWTATTVQRIAESRMNIGEVWVNRYKKVGKRLVERPKEEWILLPSGTAPSLIDEETFEKILSQIKHNRQDSLRNNQHKEDLGLLRAGYIFCGICGRRMILKYPSANNRNWNTPVYRCQQKDGKDVDISHNHRTQIHVPNIDEVIKQKIGEVLVHPEIVRAMVAELRDANKPVIAATDIEETLENIRRSMQNLYRLAENATDDETIAHLTERMNNLEKQKRDAEAMLFDLDDDEEERAAIEKELQKFEAWVESVKPFLTNPAYMATAGYEELRLAIRILGIRVTVFPSKGNWPFRYQIVVTVPEVLKQATIVLQSTAG